MRMLSLVAMIALSSGVGFAQRELAQRNPLRDRAMRPYKVGFENLRAEQWDKAAAAFGQAIDIDPSFEMAHYMLGRVNMLQKKYTEAAAALVKCRDLYLAQAGRHFANQQEAQRYRRERIAEIDEVMRQYQNVPQTTQAGEALRQLGEQRRQLNDAIQQGTNVTIDASVPPYVTLSLGSAYFRMGRLDEAERAYKATVDADPKTGEAHSNLAVVYLQTGRYDDAEKAVKAAEKTGFKVNPALKDDIAAKKKIGSD
jgi:tetratricopeptide (TPR) repeat protein